MYRICIAGRPNVGKSTLFNRLYGRRLAITDSMPGVTRDAVAVEAEIADRPVLLVDTGGIGEGEQQLDRQVYERSRREIARADVVLLLVDVQEFTGEDEELLEILRRSGRPAILVVNKVDNETRSDLVSEFWRYGIPHVVSISAAHGRGMDDLEDAILELLPAGTAGTDGVLPAGGAPDTTESDRTVDGDPGAGEYDGGAAEDDLPSEPTIPEVVRLAILGRPNTGKSSLLNRLVGEDRAIVSDIAGTTRDIVEARFAHKDTKFLVVDTAGIRRKSKVHEAVEYYAVHRALQTIEESELVVLMIDVLDELSDQDKKIAARIADRGRGVIVALNKWDLLDDATGNKLNAITDRIRFLFPVFQHVPVIPISAHTGAGVPELLNRLVHIRGELHRRIETGPLNQALRRWTEQTPPPSGKKPIKVRYITQVSTNPVRFVIFVNRARSFPEFYLRYLQNQIRREFHFDHIPFFIEIRRQ
ncbi:MAG: ribosome biogenesis GTPase Der [Alkalispirochaeta sp.]